jgi:hypothetical protein
MEVESDAEDRHPKYQHMPLCISVYGMYCRLEDGGNESPAVGSSVHIYVVYI